MQGQRGGDEGGCASAALGPRDEAAKAGDGRRDGRWMPAGMRAGGWGTSPPRPVCHPRARPVCTSPHPCGRAWVAWMGAMADVASPVVLPRSPARCAGRARSLYSKAKVLGFKRGKRTQTNHTSLIRIEGVRTPDAAKFYFGKRLAYVYRAARAIDGSHVRVIWGKVRPRPALRVPRSRVGSRIVRAQHAFHLPRRLAGHPRPRQQRHRAGQVPEQPAGQDAGRHHPCGTGLARIPPPLVPAVSYADVWASTFGRARLHDRCSTRAASRALRRGGPACTSNRPKRKKKTSDRKRAALARGSWGRGGEAGSPGGRGKRRRARSRLAAMLWGTLYKLLLREQRHAHGRARSIVQVGQEPRERHGAARKGVGHVAAPVGAREDPTRPYEGHRQAHGARSASLLPPPPPPSVVRELHGVVRQEVFLTLVLKAQAPRCVAAQHAVVHDKVGDALQTSPAAHRRRGVCGQALVNAALDAAHPTRNARRPCPGNALRGPACAPW